MLTKRIIARLDIKGPNLVKGIHLEGLRVLGRPEFFASKYYADGADELIYMDVVASLYDKNSLSSIILRTAEEIAIPLTVGGGLRSVDDISRVLRVGADKVSLNTAAVRKPDLIREASKKFGSSTITISIEATRSAKGDYFAFTDNGREETGLEVVEWAQKAESLGAGEILLTSVDREGTGMGLDCELIEAVTKAVAIPVIAHGGVGNANHVAEAFSAGHADAVAVASILHYDCIEFVRRAEISTDDEGNVDFLKSGRPFSRITPMNLVSLKAELRSLGVLCR